MEISVMAACSYMLYSYFVGMHNVVWGCHPGYYQFEAQPHMVQVGSFVSYGAFKFFDFLFLVAVFLF